MSDPLKVDGVLAISRRRLLEGAGLLGVSAFIAACGTKGAATPAPATAAPTAPPTAAPTPAGATPSATQGGSATPVPTEAPTPAPTAGPAATPSAELNWANWTYYMDVAPNDPNKHPTLDKFKAKYGTTVKYQEVIDDNETFFGTIQPALQAGADTGWDIVTLTDWMASKLIRLGWIEQFNLANMPNFTANIGDTYKGVDWDPDLSHHAPWQSGMTGMGFDPKKTGDLTSLASFYTPDPRWTGKTEYLSEMRDTIGLTMLYLGLDPAKPTTADCDAAVAELQKAKAAGIVRGLKGNSYAEDLKKGDAVLVMAWSGDMIQVLVDKPTIKFVIADEGGMLWTDNNLIPKGAAHKGTAELLINFYYQPDIAAEVEAYVNYICPVKGADAAMKQTNPDIANNPLIFPPAAITAKLHIFGGLSEADESYFNKQFAKVLGL